MHFPIIRIESLETDKADFSRDLPYDDSILNANTDYFGELYSEKGRKDVIESSWLKELFDGIATIDTEKETITFLDEKTIRQTFNSYLLSETERLHTLAEDEKLRGCELRWAGESYKGFDTLFYWDYGYTSFGFIEDAVWRAGETFKIGNIFDAHF